MRDQVFGEWRPFVMWLFAGLVLFCLPYPYYWWALATGELPSAAEWYGQGRNHGPWRWAWQGWCLVILPMWGLFLGAPGAIGLGFRRAWVASQPKLALVGGALAVVFLVLLWIQAINLIWTID